MRQKAYNTKMSDAHINEHIYVQLFNIDTDKSNRIMIFSLPCKTMITPDYEYESVICEHYKKDNEFTTMNKTCKTRAEACI